MRNVLLAMILCLQGGFAVALSECKNPQGIESGVILSFKVEKKRGSSSSAIYKLENQTALPLTVWAFELDGAKYLSGASAGYQYPDINGEWVHHIHSVGSEFEAKPYVIKPSEIVEFFYVLPAESALRFAGGMARLVVKFEKTDLCVYSTILRATFSRSKFKGINLPGG